MTVDDSIPCGGNGKPCYGRNKRENEFWVLIAEKAYAKLYHSYHNMDGANGGNIGKFPAIFSGTHDFFGIFFRDFFFFFADLTDVDPTLCFFFVRRFFIIIDGFD